MAAVQNLYNYQEVRANRVDAHIINHKTNHIITLEMSSPRIDCKQGEEEQWEDAEVQTTKMGATATVPGIQSIANKGCRDLGSARHLVVAQSQ